MPEPAARRPSVQRYPSRRPWVGSPSDSRSSPRRPGSSRSSRAHPDTTASHGPTAPSAPVAVLNAGAATDAAHHLAVDLTRHRVHVVGIGNLGAKPPAEYQVLYSPGYAGQARLLATILKAQHPLIAPINPAAANAAGTGPRLIVVIP